LVKEHEPACLCCCWHYFPYILPATCWDCGRGGLRRAWCLGSGRTGGTVMHCTLDSQLYSRLRGSLFRKDGSAGVLTPRPLAWRSCLLLLTPWIACRCPSAATCATALRACRWRLQDVSVLEDQKSVRDVARADGRRAAARLCARRFFSSISLGFCVRVTRGHLGALKATPSVISLLRIDDIALATSCHAFSAFR